MEEFIIRMEQSLIKEQQYCLSVWVELEQMLYLESKIRLKQG